MSLTKGAITRSRKLETSSVGQPQTETMGLPGLSGFVNFWKDVHDRCARCGEHEIFGSLRGITGDDKAMNGLRNGGLMSESQILVNAAVSAVARMYSWRV